MKTRKVTWWNVLGYACLNFLGGGTQALSSAFLMLFYTAACGISPIQAGLIFTIARLLDALGNPIMGYISDNFGRTWLGKKFGRRHFFIMMGIPGVLITYPILWLPGHTFTFYLIANILYEMVFTMVIVPGPTLPAEMTQIASEKTKLVSAKQYCGTFASTIALLFPAAFFQLLGEGSVDAYFYTGLSYAIITSLSLVAVYFLTFERAPEDIIYAEKMGSIHHVIVKMFNDIFASMKIRAFRIHAGMMLLIGIYKNLAAGVFTYYVIYTLMLSKSATSVITSFATLVSFIALAVFIALCYKYGGPVAFKVVAVIVTLSLVGYFALYHGRIGMEENTVIVWLTVLAIINNVGKAGADYIPVFQLPFMADIDEAVTMERREGIFTGVNGLLSKVASAAEGFLLGVGLAYFGFTKGAGTQTASAVDGILVMTIAVPIILCVLIWLISRNLKLTKETHKLLVDEVHRIKDGGSMADVTPETKAAVEDLTGWKYEKCFGHNDLLYHENKKEAIV
ncbi:MAG: MFS transporter [Selenomonadaceae bacterium]